jgi:predicted NAD-dependent protein-ADP-ribosyltransferase YbiA (DUF1768 family)
MQTTFVFYSKSADADAGYGAGESIVTNDIALYETLNCIPHWRRKLSNFWPVVLFIDGLSWSSVEHYYQASKFKIENPAFYKQFSLESKSSLSRAAPDIAKAAGGKSGKYKGKVLRSPDIHADADFFNGRHEEEMLTAMRAKFTANDKMKTLLLATHNAVLLHYVRGGNHIRFDNLMSIREAIRDSIVINLLDCV